MHQPLHLHITKIVGRCKLHRRHSARYPVAAQTGHLVFPVRLRQFRSDPVAEVLPVLPPSRAQLRNVVWLLFKILRRCLGEHRLNPRMLAHDRIRRQSQRRPFGAPISLGLQRLQKQIDRSLAQARQLLRQLRRRTYLGHLLPKTQHPLYRRNPQPLLHRSFKRLRIISEQHRRLQVLIIVDDARNLLRYIPVQRILIHLLQLPRVLLELAPLRSPTWQQDLVEDPLLFFRLRQIPARPLKQFHDRAHQLRPPFHLVRAAIELLHHRLEKLLRPR